MKATTKRSLKLYSELAPKQQAILVFNLLAEQDGDEAHQVHEAVRWRHGKFKDAAYTDWRDRFQNVCLIVGIEYWRLNCHRHAAILAMAENLELEPAYAQTAATRLASLHAVLRDLCAQHGFDHKAALALASIPERGAISDLLDDVFYRRWLDDLNDCLPK